MVSPPFYDPEKSYEDNFKQGPFGVFADGQVFQQEGHPSYDFFGIPVYSPFGIAAGPLVNGRFVKAALDKGFDLCTYKTVRTGKYPCHPWPNVVAVEVAGKLTLKQAEAGVKVKQAYSQPLSVTNSFGVPSFDPDFWQQDLAEAVAYAKDGQVVIGSFQGTPKGSSFQSYVQDFILAARLVKQAGAKVLEVNTSCPNEGSARLLCFNRETVVKVIDAIKNEIGNTPLIVKLAYFESQDQLGELIKTVGQMAQGFEVINSIPSFIVDESGRPALPGEGRLTSGVCGSGIKWAGLDMVEKLKDLRNQPQLSYSLIGVGGVMKAEDFLDYKKAGADFVMSATGAMWNPYLAQEIKTVL